MTQQQNADDDKRPRHPPLLERKPLWCWLLHYEAPIFAQHGDDNAPAWRCATCFRQWRRFPTCGNFRPELVNREQMEHERTLADRERRWKAMTARTEPRPFRVMRGRG